MLKELSMVLLYHNKTLLSQQINRASGAWVHLYNSPQHPLMMGNNLSETTSLCGGQPPADSRTPRSYAARRKVVSVVSKYAWMKNADAPPAFLLLI
jgi:hypothetical protein